MGRQIARLYQMIGNFESHFRKKPAAIVSGGEELKELIREVGGFPYVVCGLPVYLVDQDLLGVVEDPAALGVIRRDPLKGKPAIGEDQDD